MFALKQVKMQGMNRADREEAIDEVRSAWRAHVHVHCGLAACPQQAQHESYVTCVHAGEGAGAAKPPTRDQTLRQLDRWVGLGE